VTVVNVINLHFFLKICVRRLLRSSCLCLPSPCWVWPSRRLSGSGRNSPVEETVWPPVDNALRDIVAELHDYADSAGRFPARETSALQPGRPKDILDVLDTNILDALVRKYVDYHLLDHPFHYAIIKTANDSVIYRSPGYLPGENTSDPYRLALAVYGKKPTITCPYTSPTRIKQYSLNRVSGWFSPFIPDHHNLWGGRDHYYLSASKKLSEMKNDFINNVTHEFKTPISTIALAAEVLMKSGPKSLSERVKRYSRIIFDENERMRQQWNGCWRSHSRTIMKSGWMLLKLTYTSCSMI